MKLLTATFLASLAMPVRSDHSEKLGWAKLSVRLPKALSDHSASFDSKGGLVYIAGGCDAPDGNAYVDLGDGEGFFACGSISNNFYSFDPEDEEFATLTPLPRPRYRHSSVLVNNQVWLVGGRTLEDVLIPEVDVFDIATGTWETYDLSSEFVVSDHAGFAGEPSLVYIVGGYDQNYTAFDQVAVIDAAASTADGSLSVTTATPLSIARGDIYGLASQDGNFAYVAGGFTHENGFCAPLENAEQYDFRSNQWSPLPMLLNERGEVVLAELNGHLYSMGGERQIEGVCELTGDTDPGELTEGTDLVEELNLEANAWEIVASFPDHKFRFAAVSVPETGLIYAFGGQTEYDASCTCFKTTDDVAILGEGLSAGSSARYLAGLVFTLLGTLVILL